MSVTLCGGGSAERHPYITQGDDLKCRTQGGPVLSMHA